MRIGRRTSLESLLDLAARLPWWLGVALAIAAYLILETLVSTALPVLRAHAFGNLAAVVSRQMLRAVAGFLQYFVPLLLVAGVVLGVIRQRSRRATLALFQDDCSARLSAMSWHEFEMLVGEAFRRRGFVIEESGRSGPGGGIDLVLSKDGGRYLVQCRRWRAQHIGASVVRELLSGMVAEQAAGGFVVTSGSFTREAVRFAQGLNIELVNGAALEAMIVDIRSRCADHHSTEAIG